jgi:hypothetical protein
VSTRSGSPARASHVRDERTSRPTGARRFDQAEEVALVARAKRELLLRVHRHRLRREDLEDAYDQAALELVAQARRGVRFVSALHIANKLEQRFLSRVYDRRRALSGRSPIQAALETALPLDCVEPGRSDVADMSAEVETLVLLRHELRRLYALSGELTDDQRLVLASQIAGIEARKFCARHGWSTEKYRKVAQRARARLRALMEQDDRAVPSQARGSEKHNRDAL